MIRSVSALDALTVFASVVIIGAVWRYAAASMADKPLGRAMAALY